MKKLSFQFCFLIIMLLVLPFCVSAQSSQFTMAKDSDFEVTLANDGGVLIIKYLGKGGNIEIPAIIQGLPVTEIDSGVKGSYGTNVSIFPEPEYSNIRITGLKLPNGLKKIGEGSLSHINITTLIIPDSVEYIGKGAFGYTNLQSIEISKKYFTFDEYNVWSSYLKNEEGGRTADKKTDGQYLFENLRSKTFTLPQGINYIPRGIFFGSQLESIVIPEGVIYIDECAFERSKLKSITLPSTLKAIMQGAFTDTNESLIEVIIPSNLSDIYNESLKPNTRMPLAVQSTLKRISKTDNSLIPTPAKTNWESAENKNKYWWPE